MEIIAAITTGMLAAIGIWLMLSGNLVRILLGVVVLGNAVNLGVVASGRLGSSQAAFTTMEGVASGMANPLPQALVLTAIVIGFALLVFALAVALRAHAEHDSLIADDITREALLPAPDLPAADAGEIRT
ncbi:MAG: Na+/H+ antiporter subunit C [Candidatus Dactylopiibacterium carminicum]|nr:MAG: Na+/H+ antiporter subunit C [Candidatus Dactylopiibacterium carminicum]